MTKNESKLLSIQGIAKASAFCLLLSAFSVNAAMAAPAPAGTVDEVMAVQQGKKVTGVVIDGTGEPVIGANVVVKGTTNGTITDFDGNYTIEGVSANDVLVISYIGYLSQEVPVGNQSMIKVTLKEDTQTLDEVVVVGYGTMKKSDVTGSISTAKGDDLVKNQSFSALDNLRGKVSGVNIFSNSSQPGAYSNRVVIRGIATINSSSNPLYVVDGVVMENFDLVNPNDIESMEVLKDASAAAIYGARGANGVIMVTTKRGKKDGEGVAISYQGSVSVSSIARKMDLLNAQEWTDTFMKGLENENKWLGTNWSTNRADWFTDRRFFDSNGNPLYDTDWQDEAYRTAISHNHQISMRGGTDNTTYGLFVSYKDENGIMLESGLKRYSGKITLDTEEKGEYGPYKQSLRKEIYQAYAKYLIEQGKAYPCFCSQEELNQIREKQEAAKIRPGYYGIWAKCRGLTVEEMAKKIEAGEDCIIRLKSPGREDRKIKHKDVIKGNVELKIQWELEIHLLQHF